MGSGGSSTAQAGPSPYSVDSTSLQQFLGTKTGSAYASLYDPKNSYVKNGSSIYAVPANGGVVAPQATPQYGNPNPRADATTLINSMTNAQNTAAAANSAAPGPDVTQFMTAYESWQAGNNQSQQNWKNYSQAVAANQGGEGDNTITTGAAVGQRQQLLGALAAEPTVPTEGLGPLGATTKRLGAFKK